MTYDPLQLKKKKTSTKTNIDSLKFITRNKSLEKPERNGDAMDPFWHVSGTSVDNLCEPIPTIGVSKYGNVRKLARFYQ